MWVPIKFDIAGERQYSRAFTALASRAADLTVPLTAIGKSLVGAIGAQFESEGSAGLGDKWAQLSPAYAAWKEEHYPGRPLLVASGDMRTHLLDRQEALHVDPMRLVYEPQDDIAIYHQRGTDKMPARKLVALAESERRGWDREFVGWLRGLERGRIGA